MGISVETLAAAKKYTDKKVSASSGGGTIEITESSSSAYAKIYTVKQDGVTVGVINIPKDMVVQSGTIVENPTGYAEGKYLELTLANSSGSKVYISVSDLVDVYTVQANATQIQLSITNNQISAAIVAGSVGTTQLSTSVNNTLNSIGVHIANTVSSETGAHGLRYYNGALQYNNNGTWVTLSIADLII